MDWTSHGYDMFMAEAPADAVESAPLSWLLWQLPLWITFRSIITSLAVADFVAGFLGWLLTHCGMNQRRAEAQAQIYTFIVYILLLNYFMGWFLHPVAGLCRSILEAFPPSSTTLYEDCLVMRFSIDSLVGNVVRSFFVVSVSMALLILKFLLLCGSYPRFVMWMERSHSENSASYVLIFWGKRLW